MFLRLLIPLGLAVLCVSQPALAQQPPPGAGRLKVTIIAGQGAVNNIVVGVGAQPIVEVLDEKGAPVVGADVTFEAPASGPGGTFNGQRTLTAKTDNKGRALAGGFSPNSNAGGFQILVKAVSGTSTGDATITQTNGGPGLANSNRVGTSNRNKKLWAIAAIAAGAAVGGGVAATRGGSSSTVADVAKKPVTIGAGALTVGGPR